jgi:hypothetical protein
MRSNTDGTPKYRADVSWMPKHFSSIALTLDMSSTEPAVEVILMKDLLPQAEEVRGQGS